jgi:hypothetical protein
MEQAMGLAAVVSSFLSSPVSDSQFTDFSPTKNLSYEILLMHALLAIASIAVYAVVHSVSEQIITSMTQQQGDTCLLD